MPTPSFQNWNRTVEKLRDLGLVEWIVLLVVAAFILMSLDMIFARRVYLGKGHVIQMDYSPSRIVTVTDASTENHLDVVHVPAAYTVVVAYQGKRIGLEVGRDFWAELEEGQIVRVYERRGLLLSYGYSIGP